MKITFFISDWGGCGYYRCVVPAQYLIRNGVKFRIQTEYKREHIDDADLIVLQRQFDVNVLSWQKYAQDKKIKVVFECDDDIFNVPHWNPTKVHWRAVRNSATEILRRSDLVTVTNSALKREFSKYNDKVLILENCIDFKIVKQLEEKDYFLQIIELDHKSLGRRSLPTSKIINEKKELGTLNIGWAGSFTHERDLIILEKVLPTICRNNPKVMIYMAGFTLRNLIDKIPRHQLRLIEGVDTPKYLPLLHALRLDIGLCPVEKHIFNEGKSNLKALEYLSVKAVPVASNFGSYKETLENYKTGFLCSDNPEHWIKTIQKLIDSKALRQNVAEDGYEFVKQKFNIEHSWKKWLEAYEGVLNGSGSSF